MTQHEFGGDWTDGKLECLRKYLVAYTTIFRANPWARTLTTTYVDAFAGTGYRTPRRQALDAAPRIPELDEPDAQAFLKGSARIALEVEPSFGRYLFIEQDAERAAALEQLRTEFPAKASRIGIEATDANRYLMEWCSRTDWRHNRAVVFLDPYGMQVEWRLIEAIAKTKGIDLWLLFPLGVAVNRLLTKSEPPPDEWANALTRTLGTDAWRDAFYPQSMTLTLFGEESVRRRQAGLDSVGQFFVERLKTIFAGVADNPLPLVNSKNVPLYLLCFAVSNPQGAPTAVKIAQHILSRRASDGGRKQD